MKKRGILEETCKKFGYLTGYHHDQPVHICNVRNEQRELLAQKVRYPDKSFSVRGKLKNDILIGMHLFTGGRRLIITEGEIDMLSVSQAQGNKYPVVSLPNGAQSARKVLTNCLDYLKHFDEVVLCFDNDEAGRKAAKDAAEGISGVVDVRIARLSMKDANDMLLGGCADELIRALWNADPYKPEGLLKASELLGRVLERKKPEQGLPWFLPELTKATYGRRGGDVIFLGAGTGVGKTDFLTQQMEYDTETLGERVTGFFLEQDVVETYQRLMGKADKKLFHVPDGSWTEDEYVNAAKKIAQSDKLTLFDAFGLSGWDSIKSRMAFQAEQGDRIFYIDHLTALATGADERDEKAELERITAEMAEFAKQRNVIIIAISHLTTPDKGSHEEGARVMIRHFKGSRAIGFWAYFMFALERNAQSDDEDERTTTRLRVLKDRFTGQSVGNVFCMGYDRDTGLLYPKDDPQKNKDKAEEYEFKDHTAF
ncbi:hypothetical protein BZG05_14865 [Salinivibrio kushneri]|nr:hypothetical protein BZG05_14865 [Salinivibrio kushneri]